MANEILLADADVLIDYLNSDLSVLQLTSRYIGPVKVTQPVLNSVNGLSATACKKHRIEIIEASTELLLDAGARSGALSFEDWICFLLCKQEGWTCVTNDRRLLSECRGCRVETRRGLSLMIELVRQGRLTDRKARRIAQKIAESNPYHINDQVLEGFTAALDEL